MSIHLFKSINGHASKEPEATPDDMARELALEMIDRIKERRTEARLREVNCEESTEWLQADADAYATLETLLKGRHRKVVLFELFKAFPELVTKMKVN